MLYAHFAPRFLQKCVHSGETDVLFSMWLRIDTGVKPWFQYITRRITRLVTCTYPRHAKPDGSVRRRPDLNFIHPRALCDELIQPLCGRLTEISEHTVAMEAESGTCVCLAKWHAPRRMRLPSTAVITLGSRPPRS